jgi:hypothetical protein
VPEGGKARTSWGRGAGAEAATTGVNPYLAFARLSTEPATTPPSPHREHRNPLLFSPPWSLSCDAPRRRDAPSLILAWLLAVAPQDCRTATEGAPEPPVLLGAAVAVRGRDMGPAVEPCSLVQECLCAGLRAGLFVQGRERRRDAARRALGTRRPRRANELGRAGRVVVPGFAPWFLAGGDLGPSRRDAPPAGASCPATGTTRRPPRASPRMRALVRPAHPSAEPGRALRPGRGEDWALAARGPGAGDATRSGDAAPSGFLTNTWCARNTCAC